MYSQRFVFVVKNNFCISLSARSWFSLAHFGAPVHDKERKRICERPLQRNGSLNWAKNSYNRAKQQHKDSDRMKHGWKETLSRHQIIILGRLSNHDNKNVTNLHIWQWQTIVLHALHVQFSFLKISQTFWFFPRREMTCFAVVWTTWACDDKSAILSSSLWSAGSNLIPG